jgi:hypothetical protein
MDDDEPFEAIEPGRVEFGERTGAGASAGRDLFDEEERPPKRLVLVVMVEEDAPDLIAALRAEGVGARLGERTDDGGVEVLVHDTKLPAAQAVLVEFTGDPALVDAVIEADEQPEVGEGADDGFVEVASGGLTGMSSQLERLRAAGIDVRVETDGDADPLLATGALMVHPDDVERAREVLGIAV